MATSITDLPDELLVPADDDLLAIDDSDENETKKIKLSTVRGKCEWAGAGRPTGYEDAADGWARGSRWFDATTGELWVMALAGVMGVNEAVWLRTAAPGDRVGALIGVSAGYAQVDNDDSPATLARDLEAVDVDTSAGVVQLQLLDADELVGGSRWLVSKITDDATAIELLIPEDVTVLVGGTSTTGGAGGSTLELAGSTGTTRPAWLVFREPGGDYRVAQVGGAGGGSALELVAPGTPGAYDGLLAGNTPAGETTLLYLATPPTGEPAEGAADGPYYLHLDNGAQDEFVVVLERTGTSRVLAAPLVESWTAEADVVAFAGYATTPVDAGLMSAADFHKLRGIAVGATAGGSIGTGVVAVGRANSDGSDPAAAAVDHVHDGGVVAITSIDHTASPFSLLATHHALLINNAGGALSVQLPDPAAVGARSWALKITSASKLGVTLLRNGTETIEGYAGSKILRAPHGSWTLICDGTNWRLLGKNRLDLIYEASDTLVVQGGWNDAEIYMRAGAGGGGGGGAGREGASAGTTGGGAGRGGGGGASAYGQRRGLALPAPGTTLTITVGAGGAGGDGGVPGGSPSANGTQGSASEILDGATSLLRSARNASTGAGAAGGSGGGAGTAGSGGGTAGTTGGTGAAAATAIPQGWGFLAAAGGNGGAGGAGVAGANGTATGATSGIAGPWVGTAIQNASSSSGGALSGGTHGGGGSGGAGGAAMYGDDYSADGVVSTNLAGKGGSNTGASEGAGGAGNSAGDGVAGNAGAAGIAGTNGRGGGGGMGGGGGGSASGTGGAGANGGVGGAGSDGLIVITVWE